MKNTSEKTNKEVANARGVANAITNIKKRADASASGVTGFIRVTSGQSKNVRLMVPEIENFRAVQDVVKLSIFSFLGEKTEDAVCLDLYAGSGSLGIEALSRGAKYCDFVDEHPKSKETIKKNLTKVGYEIFEPSKHKTQPTSELENAYETYRSNVYAAEETNDQQESDFGIHTRDSVKFTKRASEEGKKYDIIFADPFYENTSHKFLMQNLSNIINPTGFIIFLHGDNLKISDQIENTGLKIVTHRKFGKGNYTVLAL